MTTFIPNENIKFSKKLTAIKEQPDKVVLEFEDGEIATTSVLAGADGIASTVRDHLLRPIHPEQAEPVYSGAYCYRGVIPISEAKEILGDQTDVAKIYMGHNQSAVTYRITGGEVRNPLPRRTRAYP
jgi:salicylate hydroxylase